MVALLDHAPGSTGRIHEHETRPRPRGHAAIEVLRVVAPLHQATDRRGAPRAGAAHGHDVPPGWQLAQTLAEFAQRDVLRAVDVSGLPFVILTDIEQVVVGQPRAEILWRHAPILPRVARDHPTVGQNGRIQPPYPIDLVPLIPEFLNRRRARFTYPLRVMEELGIDRPAFGFVIGGVALQPDEGARMVDIYNPYPTVFDANLAAAAAARGAGLVDEVGGRWRATTKGRELLARVRTEADAYLATLTPIPTAELARLAGALGRALAAIEASDVPKDHIRRTVRFRGDGTVAMVALENALFGLWQARDDCHMASWRTASFDGPTFDVLTRIWRQEAKGEPELAAKVAQQRPEDVRAGVSRLRRDGLVRSEALEVTERGAGVRQGIEDETDRRFFSPWPVEVGAQAPWIRDRLAAVNAALAPAP